MEEKHHCEECNKDFNSREGLEQHKRDKHSAMSSHDLKEQKKKEREEQLKKEKDRSQRSKMTRKILIVGGVFLGIAALVYAFIILGNTTGPRLADEQYILTTNLRTHSGVSMHIHPHLKIIVNNEDVNIPADIGIMGGIMSVIHTHDATGTIHLESPVPKDFTVGHFFFVWSRTAGEQKIFNSTCVLAYCNDGNKTVKMFVNGAASNEYGNYIMHDLDRIEIKYG